MMPLLGRVTISFGAHIYIYIYISVKQTREVHSLVKRLKMRSQQYDYRHAACAHFLQLHAPQFGFGYISLEDCPSCSGWFVWQTL